MAGNAGDVNVLEADSELSKITTKKKEKYKKPGIIYLSRIPTYMNVKKIRHIFEKYGEIGRVFLQPDGNVER